MGLVEAFQRRFLAETPGPADDFWYESPMGLVLPRGGHLSITKSLRLDTVYACVALLARTFGSLPLKIYQKFEDGTREERTDHPLYEVLHYQPNEYNTAFDFGQWEQLYIELVGNSYARIVTGRNGRIEQLLPLDPYRMEPVQKQNGQIIYEYRPANGGETQKFLPEEVHHIKNMSLDGLCGLSTLSVWSDVIGYGLVLQDYANRFTRNDARPGGLIKFTQNLKKEAKDDLRRQWEEMQGGFNRGRVAVVDGGGDFTAVSVSNKDAQFIEARQFSVPQIARLFGLPPTKIGWLEKSSYSNVEELNIATVIDAYLPRAVQREQAIRRDLFTPAERAKGFFAEYDLNGLLRGNQEQRYQAYGIAIDKGWLVRNEARRYENLNPLPGLDKPLVPMNMTVVEADGSLGQSTGAAPQNGGQTGNGQQGAREPRESMLAATAALGMVRSECAALRRANTRESKSSIAGWIEDYYSGFSERLVARLGMDAEKARKYSETHRKNAIAAVETNGLAKTIDGWERDAAGELAVLALEEA